MPFIVTTKRRHVWVDVPTGEEDDGERSAESVSRRAVATLEEARTGVTETCLRPALLADNYAELAEQFNGVREQGGSVGPLPDGTVIDVAPVTWDALCLALGLLTPRRIYTTSDDELIAAYNAKQAA